MTASGPLCWATRANTRWPSGSGCRPRRCRYKRATDRSYGYSRPIPYRRIARCIRRGCNRAHHVANCHPATLELLHPMGAARVGLPFEHVPVQLIDDLTRIRRARLLCRGDGRKEQCKHQYSCAVCMRFPPPANLQRFQDSYRRTWHGRPVLSRDAWTIMASCVIPKRSWHRCAPSSRVWA